MTPPGPVHAVRDTPLASLFLVVPPVDLDAGHQAVLGLVCVLALLATAFFSFLASSLRRGAFPRLLAEADASRRERLLPLLARSRRLATSAGVMQTTGQVVFVVAAGVLLLNRLPELAVALLLVLVGVPLLVAAAELPPGVLHGARQDTILVRVLPGARWLLEPAMVLAGVLEGVRRTALSVLRLPHPPHFAHQVAEDLRAVLEDSDLEGELDATERELIENVVEFHDVDVGEVMTPRTELRAVEVESGLDEVARTIVETGHTRIPVFRGNLDTMVGVVYAQDVVRLLSEGDLRTTPLSEATVPISFVPETKRVSQLLTEFRRDRRKIAVVLDEYGGTAGIVTLGDLVEELVGDIREELGEVTPAAFRKLEDDHFEVQASTRISEVNEELDLELPEEEDYETLAGFVLSELGHFPKRGTAFEREGVRYVVVEANDRRVFVVRIQRLEAPAARTGVRAAR